MEASETSSAPRDTDGSAAGGAAVVDGDGRARAGADTPTNGGAEAPPTPAGAESGPGSRTTWILVVCCVAQFMVILDLSIVNVALPSIQSSLSFCSADLQWVVDAYAIAFAGFLMLGGRAADELRPAAGVRRRARRCSRSRRWSAALSTDQRDAVIARGVQGFSCAFMAASSLAIITSSFPPGPQLHRAIGLWAAMNGLGGAAGVLFGGIITQALSWRWVLLINPPIGFVDRGHRVRGRDRPAPRPRRPELRPRRRGDAHRRPDGARVRRRPGGPAELARRTGARPDPRRARPARRVRPDRVPLGIGPADPVQGR